MFCESNLSRHTKIKLCRQIKYFDTMKMIHDWSKKNWIKEVAILKKHRKLSFTIEPN